MSISMVYVAYAIYAKLFLQTSPRGFTALLVAVTFLSGIVLFFLGIIGEYVGRIYEETKGGLNTSSGGSSAKEKVSWEISPVIKRHSIT